MKNVIGILLFLLMSVPAKADYACSIRLLATATKNSPVGVVAQDGSIRDVTYTDNQFPVDQENIIGCKDKAIQSIRDFCRSNPGAYWWLGEARVSGYENAYITVTDSVVLRSRRRFFSDQKFSKVPTNVYGFSRCLVPVKANRASVRFTKKADKLKNKLARIQQTGASQAKFDQIQEKIVTHALSQTVWLQESWGSSFRESYPYWWFSADEDYLN